MLEALYLKEIINHIQRIEGHSTYDRWVVTFSYKELNQFRYDAKRPTEHILELGAIDFDAFDSFKIALKDVGLNFEVEPQPKYIYLHRLLSV